MRFGENFGVFRRPVLRTLRAALLASVFCAPVASADSLTDAFVKAYQSNPQLLAERANLRATDEGVSQAIAQWRPTITLSGDASYVRSDLKTDPSLAHLKLKSRPWGADVTLSQNVFTSGRILFQRKQADAQVRAGRAQLHSTEQQIFINTVSAYENVVRDTSVVGLNNKNVTLLKKQLEAAQARFDVGEITRTDVAQAQAALASGQSQLIAAEASLKASRLAYERVVGEAPGTLDAKIEMPAGPESEEDARKMAEDLNPVLVGAREAEEGSRYAIDFAVAQMLPTVSVQASYGRNGEEVAPESIGNQSSIRGVLTVPIYQGGAEWSRVREAKELNNRARLDAEDARRSVDQGASNAWESFRAAKASTVANEQQVKAQEIAFEGVQQELEVGSRTTLDVLNQQQFLLNAQVALVTSQRDQAVAAYALLSAVGKLTAKELQLPVQLYDPVENYEMQTWRPLGAATYGK